VSLDQGKAVLPLILIEFIQGPAALNCCRQKQCCY